MVSFTSSAVAALIAAASSAAITAQSTIDALNEKITTTDPAPPGKNVDGGSVFANFARAYDEGQLFFTSTGTTVFEQPGSSPVSSTILAWCGDLSFSDISNSSKPVAYAGRCVAKMLRPQWYDDVNAAGAQIQSDIYNKFIGSTGISAVYVDQLNIFQGELHNNADNWITLFWDDGRATTPSIGFETHDAGDMHPNALTSAYSARGEFAWLSTSEAEALLNMTLTPEQFTKVYNETWRLTNSDVQAEAEVIEEVLNETSTDTVDPDSDISSTTNDAESNTTAEDPSAGTGRNLVSTATRVVSAVLRLFSI